MANAKTLHQLLIEELGKRNIDKTELPICIDGNLNPGFPMRPYQIEAFQFFVNYWEETFVCKPRQNHQLLFHMATGSGKTLMMAGMILYLYQHGYRNFLFFVNSSNIINKTRSNFLDPQSSKHLFAESVSFGDRRVTIHGVDNFQAAGQDDINIVFSTIQGLHANLNTPRENSLTYEDFEDQKIVLISDEAHHINADTKKGKAQPTEAELFEIVSWEGTVERIFKAHPHNVLLEFTATVDMADENLAAKYGPRLIYDYPLRRFRQDGYSKEVKVLQADMQPFERALQAVLLSQYRHKIFEKHKKHIKPVIMFKSKTIKDSQAFYETFKQGIQGLRAATLVALRDANTDPVLKKMFDYFAANRITFGNLIAELKEDFAETKLISVNSKEESEAKQLAVNTLEEDSNKYRGVFAVDKLNEGWDVLNLFDIVRLYDTRDSKAGQIGKTTMSEAQLIGRGARYCPFQITDDQPLYGRKFDDDLDNELRICEELYYHSSYNPKYIHELNTALQEIGIRAKTTRERSIRLKASFKDTALYKSGHIFLNERRSYGREDIEGLEGDLIARRHKVQLRTGYTVTAMPFAEEGQQGSGVDRKPKDYDLVDFGLPVIRKAIQRLDFFEFANLKRYLPNLTSVNEFITSPSYLGRVKLELTGLADRVANPTCDDKLAAATQVLEVVSHGIAADKVEFKGTKRFSPRRIKDTFTDKTLNFALDGGGGDKEFGRSMNSIAETEYHLDLSKRDWYAFDDCFGTSEEKLLVRYIDKRYNELMVRFSDAWLIRNERHFKIYNFDDGRPLEPDFVLYLVGKEKESTMHYQVFIEPKGAHLLKEDAWKEEFLENIKRNCTVEPLFENRNYVVWGLPFYNSEFRLEEFTEAFDSLI